jgi:hypothetical protein
MAGAIRAAILSLPVATTCRMSQLALSQSTGVEPSRARDPRPRWRMGSANCVSGRPEVMSHHMSNRGRLAGERAGKLGGPSQASCRGIRGKRCATGVLDVHAAPNPGTTCVEAPASAADRP